ncbi:MAG: hypothetical protein R2764_00585 [Bacteroidales bacterium]
MVRSQWSMDPRVKFRPTSLPYWSHKQGIVADDGLYMPTPENPVRMLIQEQLPKMILYWKRS